MKIKKSEKAKVPTRAHEDDAGYDLFATRDIYLPASGKVIADTEISVDIPKGYFGDIRPKSGLLFNHNIATFGTVDSGYRGTIRVVLFNLGDRPYQFREGEKIAQMVLVPCLTPTLEVVEELDETDRGEGGFGSSGK